MRDLLLRLEARADAPHYRKASAGQEACRTCKYFIRGRCERYDFSARADYVCDAWTGNRSTYQPHHFFATLSQGSGSKVPASTPTPATGNGESGG